MKHQGVIYCAISPSGKKYYGFTYNLTRRKYNHKQNSLTKKNVFYCAIKKYGFENFVWKTIETYQNEDKSYIDDILRKREKYWINKDMTYLSEYGYNMTHGGDGGDTFTNKSIVEKNKINQKRSKSISGNKNPMYGKSVYTHWIEKYGKEIADKKQIERKIKSSISQLGKSHLCSEETKEKLKKYCGDKCSRYVKLPQKTIDQIIDLYSNKNYSITRIQKINNLNYYKIKNILINNNIEFKQLNKKHNSI